VVLKSECNATERRQLRLLDIDTSLAQRTNAILGDRSFAAAGLHVWNSLPPQLRSRTLHLDNFDKHSKHILVSDSCSAEKQCFLCAVYKFAQWL